MWRNAMAVFVGFFGWLFVLITGEQLLGFFLPTSFGDPQSAFQNAIENGTEFVPQTMHLGLHVGLGLCASVMAGVFVQAIAPGQQRIWLVVACVLLAVGCLKASLTWQLVPLWYHILFTLVLLPGVYLGAAIIREKK
jgi:hypothetical protein